MIGILELIIEKKLHSKKKTYYLNELKLTANKIR